MRREGQHVGCPACKRASKTPGLLDQTSPVFVRRIDGSSAVLMHASMLRFFCTLSNATAHRMKIAYSPQNRLRQGKRRARLIMSVRTYSKHLAKVGPIHSQLIGLQWIVKKEKEEDERK